MTDILSHFELRIRATPKVTQVFVLTPHCSLLYPNPLNPLSSLNGTEQSFLQRAARMITDRDLQNAVALAEAVGQHGDFAPSSVPSDSKHQGSDSTGIED